MTSQQSRRPLRGAILGFGMVAEHAHAPGLAAHAGFDWVAAVDPAEERRQVAEALGVASFASLAELTGAGLDLDFVDVAAPPSEHLLLCREALGLGLHVLCEKPLCFEPRDALALRSLAEARDRAVLCVHNWKGAPVVRRATELVRGGAVGAVREFRWRVLRSGPPSGVTPGGLRWRTDPRVSGGGIVMDHGWHAFYLAMNFFGERPISITARRSNVGDPALTVEDTAHLQVKFSSGSANIDLTWAADQRATGGEIVGVDGLIAIRDDHLEIDATSIGRCTERYVPGLSAGSYHPEWFEAFLDEVHAEIHDRALRGANLAEAGLCAALAAGAYASNGTPVAVERWPLT